MVDVLDAAGFKSKSKTSNFEISDWAKTIAYGPVGVITPSLPMAVGSPAVFVPCATVSARELKSQVAALSDFHKQTERISLLQKQASLTPGEAIELTLLLKNKWNIEND